MSKKIKVRTRDDIEPGLIQIRMVSTAKVAVDVLITEDQIYGIVEALKKGSLPDYKRPLRGHLMHKWKEL